MMPIMMIPGKLHFQNDNDPYLWQLLIDLIVSLLVEAYQ